jgi:hypothetical protein
MKFGIFLITLSFLILRINCELYSAIADMEKLANNEEKIIKEFDMLIHNLTEILDYLDK